MSERTQTVTDAAEQQNHRSYPNTGERFVTKESVAEFLSLPVRKVLELARDRKIRAYPIGLIRNQWRFRLSEVAEDITALKQSAQGTISSAAPGSRRSMNSNG